ncbi:MAG TPA: sigma-70 family RNA polymerase sigma factor [Steroidobacteraceae bacterium]|nr:sigma-70 family RNA polymerase sigma factor [Steroidobacteraceae bacterium]
MAATSSSQPASAVTLGAPAAPQLEDALADARAGSDVAFAQLIRAHERSVYSLAWRALGSAAEAEELAQDVFLQLYLDLARIESVEHLGHWLRRIASHRVIDRLRQRERRPSTQPLAIDECAVGVGGLAESAERDPLLARELARLVAELPAIPRLVLILRFQEDLDPLEIARVLDTSVNTVKSHLRRSLVRLRAGLGDGGAP